MYAEADPRGHWKGGGKDSKGGSWSRCVSGALCQPQGQFRRGPLRAVPQGAWRRTFTAPNSSLSLVEGSFCSEQIPRAAGPSGRSHRLEDPLINGFLALEVQAPGKTLRCRQTKTTGHPTWSSSGEGWGHSTASVCSAVQRHEGQMRSARQSAQPGV